MESTIIRGKKKLLNLSVAAIVTLSFLHYTTIHSFSVVILNPKAWNYCILHTQTYVMFTVFIITATFQTVLHFSLWLKVPDYKKTGNVRNTM